MLNFTPPRVIAAAFAAALFLLAAAGDAAAASYWQCTNAFDQSDAHDSCQGVAIKVQDGECWINAGCRRDNGWQYRITQITASVADTADLVVCDGNLTIDSCGGSDGGTDGGSN